MPLPGEVTLFAVKSGFICGGAALTLESFDSVFCAIFLDMVISLLQQGVFADSSFGPTKLNWFKVVLVHGDESAFWVVKVLVLFHLRIASRHTNELPFVQYFEVTPPLDAIDKALNCLV